MNRPLRLLFSTALAFLAGFTPAPSSATTMVARSVEDLTRDSHSIVRATTLSTQSAWDAQHRHIVTTVRLRALENLSGTIDAGAEFEVQHRGGIVDDIEEIVVGAPHFVPAEEVVLFLLRDPGTSAFTTMDLAQGKLEVERDAAGHDRLGRRDLRSVEWVSRGGPERIPDLASLRLRVTRTLQLFR